MKILLTGGAGYVGTVLTRQLLSAGHTVTVLDRFMFGAGPVMHLATDSRVQFVVGDVRDARTVRELVRKADAVLHLAAIVGFPACAQDADRAMSTNVLGTLNVAQAVGKDQMLVFASTGSTYGEVQGTATEDTPINPLTLYGQTKRDAEAPVRSAGGVCLRFATVFGVSPRMRLDLLVNDFCFQAVHGRTITMFEGHHRRTFLHVADAAFAYPFSLAHYQDMAGEVYNVGADALNYTKRQVAEEIERQHPYHLHEAGIGQDLDKRDYAVSYEKLTALGYRADHPGLAAGIGEVLSAVKLIRIQNDWRNA
ncbi:MAG: SDR family oxidoreductase [bacterium]|nr:SDR family oxidoreductase [bacterium]